MWMFDAGEGTTRQAIYSRTSLEVTRLVIPPYLSEIIVHIDSEYNLWYFVCVKYLIN